MMLACATAACLQGAAPLVFAQLPSREVWPPQSSSTQQGCKPSAAVSTAGAAAAGCCAASAQPASCCSPAPAAQACTTPAAPQQPEATTPAAETTSQQPSAEPVSAAQHDAAATAGAEAAAAGSPQHSHVAQGLVWSLPPGVESISDCLMLWLGEQDCAALQQLQLTYNAAAWCSCDPGQQQWQEGLALEVPRLLRRRYALVERAREANIVGLLVRSCC